VNALENVLLPELLQFALELARVSGLVIITPLPWEVAPQRVKAAMVFFLALLVHGVGPVNIDLGGPLYTFLHLFSEFMLGAAMGFVVRLAIAVAEIAGAAIAPAIGLGAASVFDPATGEADSALTKVLRQFLVLLALILGVHRVILAALVASFRELPVGSPVQLANGAHIFIELSGRALLSGVRLALPVMAVLLMVQLALAFVSRAAPSMQIFNIGFAVLLAVGAVILVLTLPDMAQEMIGELGRIAENIESVLTALASPRF
jgi:flagellar biosynthesis protein FliR